MFEEEVGLFHDLSVTALSSIVWLGLWGGHVTCPVPGNRQPDIDIGMETQLRPEYFTTYVYTWHHSRPSATGYHIIST